MCLQVYACVLKSTSRVTLLVLRVPPLLAGEEGLLTPNVTTVSNCYSHSCPYLNAVP